PERFIEQTLQSFCQDLLDRSRLADQHNAASLPAEFAQDDAVALVRERRWSWLLGPLRAKRWPLRAPVEASCRWPQRGANAVRTIPWLRSVHSDQTLDHTESELQLCSDRQHQR